MMTELDNFIVYGDDRGFTAGELFNADPSSPRPLAATPLVEPIISHLYNRLSKSRCSKDWIIWVDKNRMYYVGMYLQKTK